MSRIPIGGYVTYPVLLASCYANYSVLRNEWARAIEEHLSIGAFVFLPVAYAEAETFNEVTYAFWPFSRIQTFLIQGGEIDPALLDLFEDVDPEEEFLVMIVEVVDGVQKQTVHVHKITQVGLN
jgi:hypothetical protein